MDDNLVAFNAPSAGVAVRIGAIEAATHGVIRPKGIGGTDIDAAAGPCTNKLAL